MPKSEMAGREFNWQGILWRFLMAIFENLTTVAVQYRAEQTAEKVAARWRGLSAAQTAHEKAGHIIQNVAVAVLIDQVGNASRAHAAVIAPLREKTQNDRRQHRDDFHRRVLIEIELLGKHVELKKKLDFKIYTIIFKKL